MRMGVISQKLTHITDWFPTFLHMAGCRRVDYGGKPLDGVSQLRSIFHGMFDDQRTEILHELNPHSVYERNETRQFPGLISYLFFFRISIFIICLIYNLFKIPLFKFYLVEDLTRK